MGIGRASWGAPEGHAAEHGAGGVVHLLAQRRRHERVEALQGERAQQPSVSAPLLPPALLALLPLRERPPVARLPVVAVQLQTAARPRAGVSHAGGAGRACCALRSVWPQSSVAAGGLCCTTSARSKARLANCGTGALSHRGVCGAHRTHGRERSERLDAGVRAPDRAPCGPGLHGQRCRRLSRSKPRYLVHVPYGREDGLDVRVGCLRAAVHGRTRGVSSAAGAACSSAGGS
jgi:hypothetical protein